MPFDNRDFKFRSPVAQTLAQAAEHIRQHGWHQGGTGLGRRGETCAIQAIGRVRSAADSASTERFLMQQIGGSITLWNDAAGRTKEQVIAKLEECALLAEALHGEQHHAV